MIDDLADVLGDVAFVVLVIVAIITLVRWLA